MAAAVLAEAGFDVLLFFPPLRSPLVAWDDLTSFVMVAADVFDLVKSIAESLLTAGGVFTERSSAFGAPLDACKLRSRAAISRFTAFSSFILSELSDLSVTKPPDPCRIRATASRRGC